MHYNGVIFDFNGTLLFDDAYHVVAWDRIAMEVAGKHLSAEQMDTEYAGFPNIEILRRLSGGTLTPEQLEYYSLRKEELYRETVRNVSGGAKLVPGANELFDYLKEHEIPCAIATASIIQNIEFFVETFHLDKWFDLDKIVFSDGTIPGKPAPDIFLTGSRPLSLRSRRWRSGRWKKPGTECPSPLPASAGKRT